MKESESELLLRIGVLEAQSRGVARSLADLSASLPSAVEASISRHALPSRGDPLDDTVVRRPALVELLADLQKRVEALVKAGSENMLREWESRAHALFDLCRSQVASPPALVEHPEGDKQNLGGETACGQEPWAAAGVCCCCALPLPSAKLHSNLDSGSGPVSGACSLCTSSYLMKNFPYKPCSGSRSGHRRATGTGNRSNSAASSSRRRRRTTTTPASRSARPSSAELSALCAAAEWRE